MLSTCYLGLQEVVWVNREAAPADTPKAVAPAPPAVKGKASGSLTRPLTAVVAGADPPSKVGRRGADRVPNPSMEEQSEGVAECATSTCTQRSWGSHHRGKW